jgi:DNA-binding HxlR family transcriptional regulator
VQSNTKKLSLERIYAVRLSSRSIEAFKITFIGSYLLLGMDTEVLSTPKKLETVQCEVSDIWHVLGKAWALVILRNMSTKEPVRFSELKRALPEISNTVLSDRLKSLEKEGLISKKIYAEIPLRVEYSLTRPAKELEDILDDLGKWVSKWKPIASIKPRK